MAELLKKTFLYVITDCFILPLGNKKQFLEF